MLMGSSVAPKLRAKQSETSTNILPKSIDKIIVDLPLFLFISLAPWGASKPINEISPVILVIEVTTRVVSSKTITLIFCTGTPKS